MRIATLLPSFRVRIALFFGVAICKVRQARLGHADPKMTLHYTQIDDAMGAAAAEAIGALLSPLKRGPVQ
jgi:integrase